MNDAVTVAILVADDWYCEPYRCAGCGSSFAWKNNVADHPTFCPGCGKPIELFIHKDYDAE